MTIDNSTIGTLISILTIILGGAGLRGLIVALRTKKEIIANKDEEKKKRAEAAQIIEDTAAAQVIRVREEAEWAATALRKKKEEAQKWESECSLMRRELDDMKCRLDNDMEGCKREIRDLQAQVTILKQKNARLLEVVERLIKQVERQGGTPDVHPDDLNGL